MYELIVLLGYQLHWLVIVHFFYRGLSSIKMMNLQQQLQNLAGGGGAGMGREDQTLPDTSEQVLTAYWRLPAVTVATFRYSYRVWHC